jgi:hypothetical protein
MRLALALVFAAGCVQTSSDPYPAGPGWTGPGGDPIFGCTKDADCVTQVCARDGACYSASNIRAAHVTWTVAGKVADDTSCARSVNLYIRFSGPGGEAFGYAPVPCHNGKYTMDKLPTSYTRVELGRDGAPSGTTGSIDTVTGDVAIDLP